MQQFFLPEPLALGQQVVFPAEMENQLRRVLRVRGGEMVRIVDGKGIPFLARLTVNKKRVTAQCVERLQEKRELSIPLILAAARIKKEKWEWMLQKATELGVTVILPLITERVNEVEPTPTRLVRWKRILQEAAEQCERHRIPTLQDSLSLPALLSRLRETNDRQAIVLAERHEEKAPLLSDVLTRVDPKKPVMLLVGPEGGFSPDEFSQMADAGLLFAGLGSRILRAETASILSVGMVAQWLEAKEGLR